MPPHPHEVVNEMFDLFLQLGTSDEATDFPYLFSSTKEGVTTIVHSGSKSAGDVAQRNPRDRKCRLRSKPFVKGLIGAALL